VDGGVAPPVVGPCPRSALIIAWISPTRATAASALIGEHHPANAKRSHNECEAFARSSCARLALVHRQGELVELGPLAAGELRAVLGGVALLEPLEDLALAAGVAERGAPGVDLGVEPVERQR